ncbi:carbohydrate-binding protein [Desulfocurvus vexinensis]|uniref:carbohydrate-binding protein n=1 Tax=Desulfocurvus vexinensis TaxID=399548 RepID=UPI00048BD8F2|nr:carbohydrate-binding protein [Desulfocurvus vexinensis]
MSVSASPIINAFTGGELSPHLDGRTDHEKYYTGCRRLENFIPRPHGSVCKRSGTRFIALAGAQGSAARLVSFDFNGTQSQSYVIELGDGFLRFFTGGGAVLKTGAPAWEGAAPYATGDYVTHGGAVYRCLGAHTADGATEPGAGPDWAGAWVADAVYRIPSPWGAAALWGVNHVQSCDVLYLAHPDTAPRKLVRRAHDHWTLEELDYRMPGHDLAATAPGGTAPICAVAGAARLALPAGRSFEVATIVRALDPQGAEGWYMYKGAGVFLAEGAALELAFTASPDHGKNQIEPIHAGSVLQDRFWKLMARNDAMPEAFGPGEDGGSAQWPAVVGLYEDRLVLGATRSRPLTLWMSRTGAHEDFRLNTASFIDGVQDQPLDDDAIEITLSGSRVNPIRWIADQEELLVGTNAGELKVWSGLEGEGMTPAKVQRKRQSSHGSAAVQPEPVSGAVLFVSRSGRKVREMAYDITSYKYASPELTLLAEHVTGPGLRDMAFAREPDGVLWAVRHDGVLAACTYLREQGVVAWHRHLLGGDGRCESVATVPGPEGDEVWMLVRRESGAGGVLHTVERLDPAFDAGERHGARAQDAAGGFFLDCGLSNCARVDAVEVEADTGRVRVRAQGLGACDGDRVLLEGLAGLEGLCGVECTVGGADPEQGSFALLVDGAWVDGACLPAHQGGGLCWRRVPAGLLGGLGHLEGREVAVVLDGALLGVQRVQGGAVALPRAAWKVHAGLPYSAVLQPMRLEAGGAGGTAQTRRKRIMGVTVRLRQTVGGRVCPGDDVADKYERLLPHTAPVRAGMAPPLLDGDREVRLASGYDRDGLFTIRQDDPLPMTVVCCVPQVQGEG